MKVYKYIYASEIENYSGWDIECVLPHEDGQDMLVISKRKIIIS